MGEPYLVGIGSASGAGKDTFISPLEYVLKAAGLKVGIVSTDDVYRNLSDRPENERILFKYNRRKNFDHPSMIDFDKLIGFIKKIRAGEGFTYPEYEFKKNTYHQTKKKTLKPNLDVAIVQGIYALYAGPDIGNRLIDLYDRRLFIDTNLAVAVVRRFLRDVKERGREDWDIGAQLIYTVIPMFNSFVLPTRENAHDKFEWDTIEKEDKEEEKSRLLSIVLEKAGTIASEISKKTGKKIIIPEINPSIIQVPQLLSDEILELLKRENQE